MTWSVPADAALDDPGSFEDWNKVLACLRSLTGEVKAFAGAAVPDGWLDCDGSSLLRADYPDLFAVIGTTWGSADGTHFNIPDLRGRTPIGVGTGSGLTARALAASGGTETHALSSAELASHSHTYVSIAGSSANGGGSSANRDDSASTGGVGSGTAHNNMQPYKALYWIIKT